MGVITNVSLSRPAWASALRHAPSQIPASWVPDGVLSRDGRLPRAARAGQQCSRVDAHQRRGHDAERGQRAVATTDARVAVERAPKATLAGELLEARPGIGDRDEAPALLEQRPEVGEQRQRLDRAPRLRGDHEQGVGEIDGALHRTDRGRVGRVEDVQRRPVATRAEGPAQDLRGQRGAAHAKQDDVCVALPAHLLGERLEVSLLGEHPLGDRQPGESVGDLGGAGRPPQGRVGLAQSPCHVVLPGEGDLLLDRRSQQAGDVLLEAGRTLAHATIVVATALV